MKTILTLVLVLFAAAACRDHGEPVGLDEPTAVPEVPVVADAGREIGRDEFIGESFRHRLALELDFAGGLEPHHTVTLNIEGTATQKLSGGAVRVLLPTFAAMDEAGGDKRPSYPVGKALPVHSRWALPIMDAGEQWRQSVDIELPDKGYYQVIVAVVAEAIDDKDPAVIGAYDHERWMLVTDTGGLVTYFLDPDEVPDGVLPEAGPIRNAARPSQAAADGFGDVGMDAGDDEVEFSLSLYSNGYLQYADGAELWVTYYDENDDDAVYEVKRSIGSDGLAVVPCPASDEYAVAAGVVTDTYYVDGTETLGSTVVWDSDCGDTVPISVNSYAYLGWRHLNGAAEHIKDHFVQIRSAVHWYIVNASSGTFYWPYQDAISLAYDYAKNPWAAAHEYGHAYHHRALGGIHYSVPGNCRGHEIEKASSWDCAYAEGFADYAGSVGTGTPSRWENLHYHDLPHDHGEIEGNVAALFQDLIDSANESGDKTSYPPYYVGRVFESCRADGKQSRDVTDFVWCLENRVDEEEHEDAFPEGPAAPGSVSESASEPGEWDPDDIRSTWHKNVG